jgi:hypothetical protein
MLSAFQVKKQHYTRFRIVKSRFLTFLLPSMHKYRGQKAKVVLLDFDLRIFSNGPK